MKKKLLFILSTMLIMSLLTACGTSTTTTDGKSKKNTKAEEGEVYEHPFAEGDFVYKNEDKLEIIGLTEQGGKTFDLIFPENVTHISNVYVPADSMLANIYFMNKDVIVENCSFANSRVKTVKNLPNTITEIPDNMFNNCTKLTTLGEVDGVITIPDNIEKIGEGAFSGCEAMTTVDCNDVKTIGGYAFQGCSNLTTVDFCKVETIDTGAFFGAGLTEVSLPNTTNTIGALAFFRCANLTSLDINKVQTVGIDVCKECPLLTDFTYDNEFKIVDETGTLMDEIDYSILFNDGITINVRK